MKLLLTLPGIGNNNFDIKINNLKHNIDKIKSTFSGDIDIIIFNYSNNEFDSYFDNINIIKEKNIIGQYIYNHIKPELVNKYDYIIMMVDDIILSDNFNIDNLISMYVNNNLNIISPSLHKDSVKKWDKFGLENDLYLNKLRITNFCEYFFYLMDNKSFSKYYQMIDSETYWLWGIDLALDKVGLNVGIYNEYKILHLYSGASYGDDLPDPYLELNRKITKYGKITDSINKNIIEIDEF